jgi:hypothetical protein
VVRLEDVTLQLPGEFRGRSGAASDVEGRATFRLLPGHKFALSVWTFGSAGHPDRPRSYEAPRQVSSVASLTVPPGQSEFVVFVDPLSQ